jgi:hypothetical protein
MNTILVADKHRNHLEVVYSDETGGRKSVGLTGLGSSITDPGQDEWKMPVVGANANRREPAKFGLYRLGGMSVA